MSVPRPLPRLSKAAHICRVCELALVQPASATPEACVWRVVLHCPSCGWIDEQLLDQQRFDRLDAELDRGTAQLTAALDYITELNMRSYAERFTAALAADAVLPEDF